MRPHFSLSTIIAGLVAVIVGYTSSAVLVMQAAHTAGANLAETASWFLALGIGTSLTTIGLSLYYRIPILTSWSTPGAAILISSLQGVPLAEATGAFIFTALLILVSGLTGLFEKIIKMVPNSLTSAMLVGVLLHFGMGIFTSMENQPAMIAVMFCTWLIAKQTAPRYTILLVVCTGIGMAYWQDLLHFEQFHWSLSTPVFTAPVFALSSMLSVGIPLFIVTMTSQNIPGIAVMRNAGYQPPVSPLISWTGAGMLFSAFLGGFSVCLAAITSAICNAEEAHPDASKRYMAAVWAGIFNLITGFLGASLVALFVALPKELLLAAGGLALLSTLTSNLSIAMEQGSQREAAMVTLLVSASGISLFGTGSAFTGLVAGGLVMVMLYGYPKLTALRMTKLSSRMIKPQ